jgi:NAD+ kinase
MDKKAIALASRLDSEYAMKLSRKIFDFLIKKGEIVYLETRIAPRILPHNAKDLIEMTSEDIKYLISVGGDGTLLRIAQSLPQENPPPIFGVNIRSLGFLDESSQRTIFKDLQQLLKGDYDIEKCSKITPYLVKSNSDEIKLNNALNEILIVSSKHSKVLQVSVKIDGVFINRSYLDGIIISTSTGSTAYNLSAGGAIVYPSLEIMQLTPLNSFARSGLKPIILPITSEIEIKLLRPRLNARIIIDGQYTIKKIQPNSIIRIRKANTYTKFVRLINKKVDYYRRLRRKIIGTLRVPVDDSPEE